MRTAFESIASEVRLRPAEASDAAFLWLLYEATHADDLAASQLDLSQQEALLRLQFRARALTYLATYPGAEDRIVCLSDGTRVGRHLVARATGVMLGVDLAILPAYQGQGIGTQILKEMQQQCAAARLQFRLQVIACNPARALYERLGFKRTGQDPIYVQMEWGGIQV